NDVCIYFCHDLFGKGGCRDELTAVCGGTPSFGFSSPFTPDNCVSECDAIMNEPSGEEIGPAFVIFGVWSCMNQDFDFSNEPTPTDCSQCLGPSGMYTCP